MCCVEGETREQIVYDGSNIVYRRGRVGKKNLQRDVVDYKSDPNERETHNTHRIVVTGSGDPEPTRRGRAECCKLMTIYYHVICSTMRAR